MPSASARCSTETRATSGAARASVPEEVGCTLEPGCRQPASWWRSWWRSESWRWPDRRGRTPSALDALTVDLLLDQPGLVVIDAAANGRTYDTAPHPTARRQLATAVLDALGVPHDTAQVDPDVSTLYHEVGFNVALHEAFANTDVPGAVRIDTGPLQKVAAGVGVLLLDVCGVAKPGLTLAVTAASPTSAPDPGARVHRRPTATTARRGRCPPTPLRSSSPGAPNRSVRRSPRSRTVQLLCGVPKGTQIRRWSPPTRSYSRGTRQAHVTGPEPSGLLQAGLVVVFRAKARVDLVVPKAQVGRFSFGPPDGPRASRRLTMPKCSTDPAHAWTASGVRVWVDEAGCVPITVQIDGRTVRTVRLPVGAPCPGRLPPPSTRCRARAGMMPVVAVWEPEGENWIRWARTPGFDAYWYFRDTVFDAILPSPHGLTLEVGCGEGRVTRDLVARGHDVVALDPAPTLVRAAAEEDPVQVRDRDGLRLPFPEDRVGVVVTYNVLQNVADLPGAVQEMSRVLRPGGALCVCVVHPVTDLGGFEPGATAAASSSRRHG